jgi:hypothetical protein
MPRFSIGRRLSRRWTLLVAVVVVALAGFAVYRLHGIFASHDVTSTPSGSENDIVPFNPKHVVKEFFGPPGTVATITYLDVNAQPQRVDAATLPWAYDTTTTQPASSSMSPPRATATRSAVESRLTTRSRTRDR